MTALKNVLERTNTGSQVGRFSPTSRIGRVIIHIWISQATPNEGWLASVYDGLSVGRESGYLYRRMS